ncbi:MAG: DUF58 domain-containing protein [Firmicutes bacterium]|nr:DUF58 domain-containing protein [Bacillota bacterium]
METAGGGPLRWRLRSPGFTLLCAAAVAFAALFGGDAPLTLAYWLGALHLFAAAWLAATAHGAAAAAEAASAGVLRRGERAAARVRLQAGHPWPAACTVRWAPVDRGLRETPGAPVTTVHVPGRGAAAALLETAPLPRGVHAWPAVEIEWSDPFGILAARRRLSLPGRIVVGPERRRVPAASEAARRLSGGARPLGGQPDFTSWYGIRPFREGDDRRLIHWRTSARRGRPHVLEFRRAWASGLALAVDPDTAGRLDAWEAAVDAVHSWGCHALERGLPVWLWTAPADGAPAALPVQAAAQLAEALAALRPRRDPRFPARLARLAETAPRPALLLVGAASLLPPRARDWARLAPHCPPLLVLTFDGRPRGAAGAFAHEAYAGAEGFGAPWAEAAGGAREEERAHG